MLIIKELIAHNREKITLER